MVTISDLTEFNSVRNKIQTIQTEYDSGIMDLPAPTFDSSQNLSVNVRGKTLKFNIDGEYNGTVAQIKAFVNEVREWSDKALVTGGLTDLKTFYDGYNTFYVKPREFKYTINVDNPGKIIYQLGIIRSKA